MSMLTTLASAALTASLTVSPQDGGSVRHPVGHEVRVQIDAAASITGFEIWWGRGFAFHRKGVPTCSVAVLRRSGPDGCPAKSIIGSSPGGRVDEDTVEPRPKFVMVNGPGGRLTAYVTVQRPARVRASVVPSVFDNPRSIWPHRDAWEIPEVLRKVAGVTIPMNHLKLTFGGKSWAKDYIVTTGCPKGGLPWRIRVRTDGGGVLGRDGRAPCRR